MDIIFSETQKFDVRGKFENYKYFDLNEYLKMSELPETWKNHEKEFKNFLKSCDISDNSIECGYDKLPLFYVMFLIFNLLRNNTNVIMNNFGYSLHPLLRRHLLLEFSKFENLCLMTDNLDIIDQLINITDSKNIYINVINIQENKILFNELLTLKDCRKRENNSEDIKYIIDRIEGEMVCQSWITKL